MGFAEFLKACQSLVKDVQCGAVAYPDTVVVTECDTRHGCYAVAVQQLVAEVDGCESELLGIDEEVECALWLGYLDVGDC